MITYLRQTLGAGWDIYPAGGLTGEAYIAKHSTKKIFIKRNSSPFLAVLSAVGIVPKLIWTKRMENGDVYTAQEWINGRDLTPADMQTHQVIELIRKIHYSPELLHMLMRLGKKPVTSDDSLLLIQAQLKEINLFQSYEEVQVTLNILTELLPLTRQQKLVVCHGDLNHNNLLMSGTGEIFLVDWDNACIQDPATDFGSLLNSYIPQEDWPAWLEKYQVENHRNLLERIYWYLLLDALDYLVWHSKRGETSKVNEKLASLRELNVYVKRFILD